MNPNAPASLLPWAPARLLWRHRHLLAQLTWREIAQRYRGSMLGLAWSLVTPLLMLAIYTFVFSVVFQARWGAAPQSRTLFAIVLFAGLSVHGLFADVLNRAPTLIVSQPNYVKRVVFPLELLPVVAAGAALFHFAANVVVLLAAQAWLGDGLHAGSLLLPVLMLPFVFLLLGLAWFIAALGVFLRDVATVIGLLTTVLMFLSPVFYAVDAVPEALRPWLMANPLTFVIEQVRALLIWGQGLDWPGWLGYTGVSGLVAWLGYAWFQLTRKGFADVL